MTQFQCRLALNQIIPLKDLRPRKDEAHPSGYSIDPGLAVQVKMHGVQGEPFGSATPYAELNMTIKNPQVAAELLTDYMEYIESSGNAKPPCYEVLFRKLEPYEQ